MEVNAEQKKKANDLTFKTRHQGNLELTLKDGTPIHMTYLSGTYFINGLTEDQITIDSDHDFDELVKDIIHLIS
ncbi:hypothetical protein [Aneurinibacillus tyrosinisolvens]|uniref:hypothetical protein n=1 Tax=Aneurinibacillus tyrosinisolvens TaxID=1443435 RepID=UPI00063FB1A8|nr:hypothetical protein [Aneurinibacillus tyrosinisolvens]